MNRFFIIGSPRSGTTLFRLMLNKHSNIIVPPEAGFLTWLHSKYVNSDFTSFNVSNFVSELLKTKKIESWSINSTELHDFLMAEKLNSYSSLMDAVYSYYANNILCKKFKLMGDKNNFFLNEIEKIDNIYPNSKFIHIIRDGRSVAVSYKDINKKNLTSKNSPSLPNDVTEIADVWKRDINKVVNSFEKIADDARCMTIRFEDLISNPQFELARVCNFLGEDFEESMLKYYETTLEEGLEPKEFDSWKMKNKQPLLVDEVNKYKQLSLSERKDMETICSDELKRFNYI